MENLVLITITFLLLIAYISDLTSSRTKIQSVIILLVLGWFVKQISIFLKIKLLNLEPLLPIFGTVGLILIVLEGSLDLEINKSKLHFIGKSLFSAFISLVVLSILLSLVFKFTFKVDITTAFINAIPFSVISSSIAIPSASNFPTVLREFVIYETSTSDILGIIFFNFAQTISERFELSTLFKIFFQLLIMLIVSFVSTFFLTILLKRINSHVKFVPIILLIILIYAVAKLFHLPALIFILIFGLFLSNFEEIEKILHLESLKFEDIEEDIKKFREIVIELTFLARSFFFLIFGYVMEISELVGLKSMLLSSFITISIYATRYAQLKLMKLPLVPLFFTVPRGLITILLFLSILPLQSISLINKSVVVQVIVFTNLIMAIGLIKSGRVIDEKSLKII